MIDFRERIVFQGDSVTEAHRDRRELGPSHAHGLGVGYVLHVGASLLADYPGAELEVRNRGVGGDGIMEMAERWKEQVLDIQPTLLSVLIGINDTWRQMEGSQSGKGAGTSDYEQVLGRLLNHAREVDPEIKIVLCEPFALPTGVVSDPWFEDLKVRQQIVADLAIAFDAVTVPFQSVFDDAQREADASYWTYDGVHPTAAGHMRMARAWLAAIGQ